MLRIARTAIPVASSARWSTTQSACQRQRVEHVEPAPVACGSTIEQRVEQRERLVVLLARLGLAERFAERLDRFRVADVGRAHEVAGRGAVVALGDEHPRDEAVQRATAGPADALVDRLLDQRVRDLVAQLATVLGLVDTNRRHTSSSRVSAVRSSGCPLERDDVGRFIR